MIVIMRNYKGVNMFDRGNIGDTQWGGKVCQNDAIGTSKNSNDVQSRLFSGIHNNGCDRSNRKIELSKKKKKM